MDIQWQFMHAAHPAITSFAVQTSSAEVVKQIWKAVKKKNNLHAFHEGAEHEYGANTFCDVGKICQKVCPLAWHWVLRLSTPNFGGGEDREY